MFPERKERFYRFDGFAVDATKRLLLRDNRPVSINPKAFALLVALIENHGQVMTKEKLLARVWPDQFIEEGNLTVHISAVRKALGERKDEHRYVVTIPGQGYQFVADIANGEMGEGLVIEQHTTSRITVEEEEDTDDQTLKEATIAQAIDIPSRTVNGNGHAAPAQLAVASTVLQQAVVEVSTGKGQRINAAIAAAVILGLLVASIFAYRLYHQRQNQRATAGAQGNAQGMTSRQLTTNGNVSGALISPDGKLFVYLVFQSGRESLWVGHVNGGDPVQLRPPEDVYYGLVTFAPDGGSIFFELSGALFQMPVLGGAPQKVLDRMAVHFSISSDGKRVAFVRDDSERKLSTIIIANLNGSGERELVTLPSEQGFSAYGPAWSPDGAILAIGAASPTNTHQTVLMGIHVADGKLQQLSSQEWNQINKVVWLGDGSGIVFHARGPQSDYHIWLLDYPQGDLRCITSDLNRYGSGSVSVSEDGRSLLAVRAEGMSSIWLAPAADLKRLVEISRENGGPGLSWTPDGKLVFVSFLNNCYSLWMMNADGSGARQITPSGFTDIFPRVTTDGRYIVFQSNRGGGMEIWRVNVDGSDLRQLTTGGGGSHPDPTPDGKWVLYTAVENETSAIWRVSIDGGAPGRITDSVSDWPRVSPDGKLLACAYADKSVSSHTQLAVLSLEDGKLLYHFDLARSATFNDGLHWSPDGSAVNYRDFGAGLWRQPLAGGALEKWPDLPNKKAYFFDWSNDGKHFAISYDDEIRDAVLINNFR